MEFVVGDVSQNDYLMVLSHELKLHTPSERQQQEEDAMQKHMRGMYVQCYDCSSRKCMLTHLLLYFSLLMDWLTRVFCLSRQGGCSPSHPA